MDTNVAVVANGKTEQAGQDCVVSCIAALRQIQEGHRVVLVDDGSLIFKEYQNNLNPSGQPGLGDVFYKWLWENQGNQRHCRRISITLTLIADSKSSQTTRASPPLTGATASSSP